jgi:hypothetical protein
VKKQTTAYLDKARELLDQAETILRVDLHEPAGRAAYMAGFHAAQALIFETSTPCVDGLLGSRASTRKLRSGSTAVMCPAYVTRCYDRWPRWVPRSSPKQHVDLEGRRYYRVLWILGSSDRHLGELSHPAATRRSEGGSARRVVTQAATWVIRSPGHSRSRAAIHDI